MNSRKSKVVSLMKWKACLMMQWTDSCDACSKLISHTSTLPSARTYQDGRKRITPINYIFGRSPVA